MRDLDMGRLDLRALIWAGLIGIWASCAQPAFAQVSFSNSASGTGTSLSFNVGTADTDRVVAVQICDESEVNNWGVPSINGINGVEIWDIINTQGLGNHQGMWYWDEDDLGATAGAQTISCGGVPCDAGYAIHATLHTGVDQTGPVDTASNNTVTSGTLITMAPGVDTSDGGLVVLACCHGSGGNAINAGNTSPIIEREDFPPSSAEMATGSGIETTGQTGKSYSCSLGASLATRGTGVLGAWDEAAAVGARRLWIIGSLMVLGVGRC